MNVSFRGNLNHFYDTISFERIQKLCAMNSKIQSRIGKLAAGMMYCPLGAIPLDRAIRTDLELFRNLRHSGATWGQIAKALGAAGVRRPDGEVIPEDQILSAVSRQLRNFKESPIDQTDQAKAAQNPTNVSAGTKTVAKSNPPLKNQIEKKEKIGPIIGLYRKEPNFILSSPSFVVNSVKNFSNVSQVLLQELKIPPVNASQCMIFCETYTDDAARAKFTDNILGKSATPT